MFAKEWAAIELLPVVLRAATSVQNAIHVVYLLGHWA
jgi:hypothetical protein